VDKVAHGAHHLFHGGVGGVTVAEVEVHVLGAQALQAGVDGFGDVLARESAAVGAFPGRPEHLAGKHQFLARQLLDGLAHHHFRAALGVHVALSKKLIPC
jgi:hypothetical protein